MTRFNFRERLPGMTTDKKYSLRNIILGYIYLNMALAMGVFVLLLVLGTIGILIGVGDETDANADADADADSNPAVPTDTTPAPTPTEQPTATPDMGMGIVADETATAPATATSTPAQTVTPDPRYHGESDSPQYDLAAGIVAGMDDETSVLDWQADADGSGLTIVIDAAPPRQRVLDIESAFWSYGLALDTGYEHPRISLMWPTGEGTGEYHHVYILEHHVRKWDSGADLHTIIEQDIAPTETVVG